MCIAHRFHRVRTATTALLTIFLPCAVRCTAGGGRAPAAGAEPNERPVQITVLYDNYTLREDCRTDWGFSCLIVGLEKTILFDTGARGDFLLENIDKLKVEAQDVDLVVISHNHLDHTGGLAAFLDRRSGIPVYLPKSASPELVQSAKSRGASVVIPDKPQQVCEHAHLTGPLGARIIEQALVLDTDKGLVVITGCAHPGIVSIVRKAKEMLGKEVYFVMGGFHLANMSDAQVHEIVRQFRVLGVRKAGPSHCTGPKAIELFRAAYGTDFVPLGIGQIQIPITISAGTAKP
jgi:7,8-dihydropterin-6-yl-methyl-4-(beta-D-ribofuranosyl)aminobenzene 5'-phosphate synthase